MAKGAATSPAALMAKEWWMRLGERSGLTGRLVFRCRSRRGAGRSRTEQDGAGRSRTEQDGAGRSRTEQDGAGRSRTEQLTGGYGGLYLSSRSLRLSSSRGHHYTTFPVTVKHANLRRLAGALDGARTHPAGHRAAAAAQSRVEQVARRVADHVQAVHHQGTIGNCFPPSRCGSWLGASATKRGHSHGFDHAASRRPRRVTGPRPCAVRGHDGGRVVS